jgi:hypothetical protein
MVRLDPHKHTPRSAGTNRPILNQVGEQIRRRDEDARGKRSTSEGRGSSRGRDESHPHTTTTTNTSFQTPHTHRAADHISRTHPNLKHHQGPLALLWAQRNADKSQGSSNFSKATIRQGDKRNLRRITIVKVLHKVLYPRRTEMDSKNKMVRLAG